MFVLGEQVVQNPESRLEIQVYYILSTGLWLWKSAVHHQLEGQGHVSYALVKRLGSEVEVVERDKVALEQPGEQAQVHAVSKLRVQIRHLQVDLVKMLVDEGDE